MNLAAPAVSWEDLPLEARHVDELQRSAISPAVAHDRGYRSVTTKHEIGRFGFSPIQQSPPGYLLPIHGVGKGVIQYQIKPDNPRSNSSGKGIKYESPGKSEGQLDVAPSTRHLVLNPDFSLFITEGIKKVDAAATNELPVIGLPGVSHFKGPDIIAALDQIPLRGRTVYIAFDSDWRRNRQVLASLRRLAAILRSRGAVVYVISLPEPQLGTKVGLDDYFVAGGNPIDLLKHAVEFESTEDLDHEIRSKDRPSKRALTDMGNAERFAAQHGADVRYCHGWSKWLSWDGSRFEQDETGAVVMRAKKTVRTILLEAAHETVDADRAQIVKHATDSEKAQRINALISLAQSEPGIPVRTEDLDRDSSAITVSNGTLNLRTGVLRPHDRRDLITKLAPVAFDPLARCETFLAFLDRIMDGKADVIQFLQRAFGYSLTGSTAERMIFILWGSGKNGKSTLLELMRSILGDYGMRTPTETLMVRRDSGIPNDIARLKGVRFVTASESDEGQRLAESKIKDLTGGDTITARFMRGEFFEFLPVFKLWLATNHKPVIRGTDQAIWDRVKLIPFNVRIPDNEQDKHLREKLMAEAPGILAWAVQGCLDWQRFGIGDPTDVRDAVASYRAEMDVLGGFIDDCCFLDQTAHCTAKAIYATYTQWCNESGQKAISQIALGKQLTERGFESIRTGHAQARSWRGIGILTVDPDDESRRISTLQTHLDTNSDITNHDSLLSGLSGNMRLNVSAPSNVSANGHVLADAGVPF